MTPTHSPWSALIRLCEGGIKRRSTFRYWEDLERSQWNSLEDLQQKQLGSLRSLLAYAFEHVPYYRNKWYHHDLTPAALTTLSDFSKWPLLNREQFRAESTSIRSNEKGLCTLH